MAHVRLSPDPASYANLAKLQAHRLISLFTSKDLFPLISFQQCATISASSSLSNIPSAILTKAYYR